MIAEIERVILERGSRGMDRLARHLAPDYCGQAAQAAWTARERALITTGFEIEGHPETDGPPGAFFLARALATHGALVAFVAEEEPLRLLEALTDELWLGDCPLPEYLLFPIMEAEPSREHGRQILDTWRPTLVTSIERCGVDEHGRYLNWRGADISSRTARLDSLLDVKDEVTIGIGDGGNEIGMGNLHDAIRAELEIPGISVTCVLRLVLAAVSNWGAYGMLAYMSALAGRDLLPTGEEASQALHLLARLGAINSTTRRPEPAVDGFPVEVDLEVLEALRSAAGRLA